MSWPSGVHRISKYWQSIFPAPEDTRKPTVVAGWKVETVLMHPNLANPSCVCTLPDGRILGLDLCGTPPR